MRKTKKDSELNGSSHSANLICFLLTPEHNFDLLLSFPNIKLSQIFEEFIIKVMTWSFILATGHEHAISFLGVYF